jgi:hypothetical protein
LIHYPIKIGLQKYETQTTRLNDWAIQIDPHALKTIRNISTSLVVSVVCPRTEAIIDKSLALEARQCGQEVERKILSTWKTPTSAHFLDIAGGESGSES